MHVALLIRVLGWLYVCVRANCIHIGYMILFSVLSRALPIVFELCNHVRFLILMQKYERSNISISVIIMIWEWNLECIVCIKTHMDDHDPHHRVLIIGFADNKVARS